MVYQFVHNNNRDNSKICLLMLLQCRLNETLEYDWRNWWYDHHYRQHAKSQIQYSNFDIFLSETIAVEVNQPWTHHSLFISASQPLFCSLAVFLISELRDYMHADCNTECCGFTGIPEYFMPPKPPSMLEFVHIAIHQKKAAFSL